MQNIKELHNGESGRGLLIERDGYVSFEEYEKMYKRCVLDEKEREPKKLYYLVQFLMFDKEQTNYITKV